MSSNPSNENNEIVIHFKPFRADQTATTLTQNPETFYTENESE